MIFTVANADPERMSELQAQAGEVHIVGAKSVGGAQLVQKMTGLGYQTVYNATGPKVLHLLLAGGVLDRLYLTHANRLLGGQPFSSIVEGDLLDPPFDMTLSRIYLDPVALDGLGQLLISYNRFGTLD